MKLRPLFLLGLCSLLLLTGAQTHCVRTQSRPGQTWVNGYVLNQDLPKVDVLFNQADTQNKVITR